MGKPRLLAVASGGGHWIELLRLRPAFEPFETSYVSMFGSHADMVGGARFYTVPDASRFNLRSFAPVFARAARILARERPEAIVTTGSAPMLAFMLLGRLTGRRTLWIDSIANTEQLSTSGRLARRLAHKVVSQWPDAAAAGGVAHWGGVL